MFVPWGNSPPDRHRSFMDKSELHSYLRSRSPHSCFHSTAYYDNPDNRKMSEKGWLGADLIFDLDGDHLPGVSGSDFPSMIDSIQHQAWRLWTDFLQPEFGFKKEYVQTTFSGHRGFHIHLRDPSLLHLDSNARREIVNHIRGEGIDMQSVLDGPDIGWGSRARIAMDTVLHELQIISDKGPERKAILDKFHDILKTRAKSSRSNIRSASKVKIVELSELTDSTDRIARLREDQTLSVFGETCTPIFWELVKGNSSVVMNTAGETDEAVTVDTKRVIRWVGSLHGKSGLRVTSFPLHRLDPSSKERFNPLDEAVVFSKQSRMNVSISIDDVVADIAGERVEGNSGEQYEVSEAMATFLVLKGWAEVTQQ